MFIRETDSPTTAATRSTASPVEVLYRLNVDEFDRIIDAGIIPADRRVWLWEGQLYETTAKILPHAVSFSNILNELMRTLPPEWGLWPENPITLSEDKAPLPDVTVIRGQPNDYGRRGRRPGPEDAGMIVGVAKSSVRVDSGTKLEHYARALLPVYWLVNLNARHIVVYSHPRVDDGRGQYETAVVFGIEESVPLVLDGREVARIPVRDLLDAEPIP